MGDHGSGTTRNEREILNSVLELLEQLESDAQKRVLNTTLTFLDLGGRYSTREMPESGPSSAPMQQGENLSDDSVPYSARPSITAKEFLRQKEPQTDIQRMACLAYYLTHYRDQPHFKTVDLSKLNTEAAQPKFSNAAKAASNAMQYRYFVQGQKTGTRQISAAGEDFVRALPDKAAAKAVMAKSRPNVKRRKTSKNSQQLLSNQKDSGESAK